MASHSKKQLVVAGLNVEVYSNEKDTASEVAVLFLLHGRGSSAQSVQWVAESVLDQIAEKRSTPQSGPALLVVAFDQRNHGSRLVNSLANVGWSEGGKQNPEHAIDMYSTFVGTSRDVSFLIDFLPAYLFPSKERTVSQWLVSGISLGGHATWISLRFEPRIRIGISIIGCADFITLMSARAKQSGIPFAPPYVPDSLVEIVKVTDPVHANYEASDESNPFIGKKILALAGADDQLVPFAATQSFFDHLNVGNTGYKRAVVAPGVGHACTPDMVKEMAEFLWHEALKVG
ncbi:Alpha/Beta hydrolase protein [Cristinia sonorae]|uniref:Alpha/Beta hydrolase protein n=1 Tax=Cristinia sonorae TaxID=1940300 RepID=A0A8K0UIJ7_9AGAR|nr:Alpha/Beta hydrolase protein [Cristinia sonorae]